MECERKRKRGRRQYWKKDAGVSHVQTEAVENKKKKRQLHQRNKKKKHINVDWSILPRNILEIIAEMLPLSDCISISNVCRNWKFVLREDLPCWRKHVFPWLLMSGEKERESRTCTSVLENRFLEMELAEASGKYCWGSIHDWLIMVKDVGCFSIEASLLNPFTGRNINLPRTWNFYHKMVLSALPSENNLICILLNSQCRELAFWLPGLNSWRKYKLAGDPFEDAVFCNGSFYLLSDGYNICQIDAMSIFSISDNDACYSSSCEIQSHVYKVEMPETTDAEIVGFEEKEEKHILKYLVESSGEVLLVCRYYGANPDISLETVKFEVYAMDLSGLSWKKIEDLGDRTLFLGKCSSRSLHSKELGVEKNTIFFSNDPPSPWWNEWDSDHLLVASHHNLDNAERNDWGIFKLGDEDSRNFVFLGKRDNWAPIWLSAPLSWYCRNIN